MSTCQERWEGWNIFIIYYHVDEEKTPTEPVMKKNYDDSSNLSHGVCTIEISFTNIDLLLGSKLYNWPLFIKGHVDEKMVNRILVDDGSTINILPHKTMKEHEIFVLLPIFRLSHKKIYQKHCWKKTKKYIVVRRIHRGAQKIVKDWLRKFINTNIKIWQYIFDWWRLYWQRKFNLRKKSPKSYIYIYIYIKGIN
jgi:hypothetical protein